MSQINRLSNGGRIDRNKVLTFSFNGQSYKAKTATPATTAKPANTPPAPAAKTPKPAA